ncbi:TonB-like protein [Chitinophaga skermanii]|uniref:TonB-like protein n=1 Tax=Chitinophaga skermanii TaxID=331697 RepID=A0A327QF68_9BACT|nr:energy transducer TonB [Chitinophaga skermanii]RAJ02528.1 TonB-like protein [Chitinophaga skermanii]
MNLRMFLTVCLLGCLLEANALHQTTADTSLISQNAAYIGGDTAMNNFLLKTINWPLLQQKVRNRGKASFAFTIEKDGSVVNVRPVGLSSNRAMESQLANTLKKMPKWQPAMLNGQAVPTMCYLPFEFEVTEDHQIALTPGDLRMEEHRAAQFPGGEQAFQEVIGAYLQTYVQNFPGKDLSGNAYVQFDVSARGKLSNINGTNKSTNKILESCIVEVLKNSDRWQPGKVNGQIVESHCVLPVRCVQTGNDVAVRVNER